MWTLRESRDRDSVRHDRIPRRRTYARFSAV